MCNSAKSNYELVLLWLFYQHGIIYDVQQYTMMHTQLSIEPSPPFYKL